MAYSEDTPKKVHRPSRSSHKIDKKQRKKDGQKVQRHNPKAFTFSGGVRSVQRSVQRTLDIKAKRERVQKIDKTPQVPPPIIVVVQGPPKCGKTTLIRSLVTHYTKQTLSEIRGPITVVSGKNRRITFIEATHELTTLVDLAKIADIVLMMIDASFGFDMQTFEFLSILKTHGFPRVLGVLSYLDKFDDNKILKKRKKKFKKRFWTEIYEGAKLFYLSGVQYRRYRKRDTLNLARYLAVQKFEILTWRSTHPYFLSLRTEETSPLKDAGDVEETSLNTSSTNDSVSVYFYGYIKGARMKVGQSIHIPGAGDFMVEKIDEFTDPCPAPIIGIREKHPDKPIGPLVGSQAMRSLKDSHRAIYAPYCDVGRIQYDSDAMYIHLPDSTNTFTRPELLIRDGKKKDISDDTEEKEKSEEDAYIVESESEKELSDMEEDGEDDDEEDYGDEDVHDKELLPTMDKDINMNGGNELDQYSYDAINMVRKLQDAEGQLDKKISSQNLLLLHNSTSHLQDQSSTSDEEASSQSEINEDSNNIIENITTQNLKQMDEQIWLPESHTNITDYIYKTPSYSEGYSNGSKQPTDPTKMKLFEDDSEDDSDSLDFSKRLAAKNYGQLHPNNPLFDDFDSAIIPHWTFLRHFGVPIYSPKDLDDLNQNEVLKEEIKRNHFATGGWDDDENPTASIDDNTPEPLKNKVEQVHMDGMDKIALSKVEKERQDAMLRMQMEVNEFSNTETGVSIGTYVRILVRGLPKDWFTLVHGVGKPILLGGLLPGENSFGFVKVRIQKHRWAPKILKSNDPLIFSIGWRRFQSIPIYFMDDRNNTRQRMLKYTPEHMHCQAVFYGPLVPPTTGILGLRSFDVIEDFRIAALGVTLESEASVNIMKKLKLVGEPQKILKNTAFIKGMFGSDLEVSKFIGAKIVTVSGIRGQIKKATGQKGIFRATFEDKVLLSDLVICKNWVRINPHKFYNTLLDLPHWRRMRLVAEIRNELGIPTPNKPESEYQKKPIRPTRRFNPLKIPKSILGKLPFASKPKIELASKKKNDDITVETKPELDPFEKKVAFMFKKMETLKNERQRVKEKKRIEMAARFAKESQKKQDLSISKVRKIKKMRYIKLGKKEASLRHALRLEDQDA